jgi:hypothetical protein
MKEGGEMANKGIDWSSVLAQVFNIFWTLLLAYLLFGGILFPAAKL